MNVRECLRILKRLPSSLKQNIYWAWFQVRYSNLIISQKSQQSTLLVVAHVLEKGLTMPNMRLGFGQERVRYLLYLVNDYIKSNDIRHISVQAAMNDLHEYLFIHSKNGYQLPKDIVEGIERLEKLRIGKEDEVSIYETSEQYFSSVLDFERFSSSRRSVRNYSKEKVDIDDVINSIRIAQTAPSACNRQATRIKIIESKENIEYVLGVQNGTRGFGHLADKILLVTTDMSSWNFDDKDLAIFDSGIFTMNLLYALHSNKICACPLNATMSQRQLIQVKNKLNIPTSEILVCFITIGYPTEDFKIAKSTRLDTNDIYTII